MAHNRWFGTRIVGSHTLLYLAASLIPSRNQIFTGTPYRFESTGSTLYYDEGVIQEKDVKLVGSLLEEMGYFSKRSSLPARLRQEGNIYTVEILLDKNKWEDPAIEHDMSQLVRLLKAYRQREFRIRFVSLDSISGQQTKLFQPKD